MLLGVQAHAVTTYTDPIGIPWSFRALSAMPTLVTVLNPGRLIRTWRGVMDMHWGYLQRDVRSADDSEYRPAQLE